MGPYSVYDVAETAPTKWKPGEELAASGFVAMTILLFADVNIGIWRIFKKKQGLYYWSMVLGTAGVLIDVVGIIIKYFVPNCVYLWPFYTLCIVGGWTIYAPAELFVLYSRLHLVNQSRKVQRWVLIMILLGTFALILPTWVIAWPAEDPGFSALWSPRKGFMDRINQIGFSLVEFALSVVYIWSLIGLLNLKSSIRQRRVMLDLIYVNVAAICLDIIVVILVFLNQLGLSHPIQNFSYMLKLKLEFIVLNQLMAVAARGLQKETFAERRYHHPSTADDSKASKPDEKSSDVLSNQSQTTSDSTETSPTYPQELVIPTPAVSHQPKMGPISHTNRHEYEEPDDPAFGAEQGIHLSNFLNESGSGSPRAGAEADKEDIPPDLSPGHQSRPSRSSKIPALRSLRHPFRRRQRSGSGNSGILPKTAKLKGRKSRKSRKGGTDNEEEEEEEEDIGIHMWERRGKLVLEVPWFKTESTA
ncbi:hypothetical protein MMC28_008950 [Mycoblastus sanguinarius]|nr:hypothetical protein [Mycoblastus sanguinarius]